MRAVGVGSRAEPPAAPAIFVADVDSVIHPVSAEFMIQAMDRADQANAAALIFVLRTPGGLLDSTRDIVTRMLAAKTPIVIFIAPSGARAASAGFILTLAADVAVMAPGTHIGAAHPVSGSGEKLDETTSAKAAQDVAAYARTLAEGRRRNIALAEEAVRESRAFTEHEALTASPPLIDFIASDVNDLLGKLDGRSIRRFSGATVVVRTAGSTTTPIAMSQRQRILSVIARPEIAFILLSLGVLGLTIELWTPGAIVPGIAGAVSLLMAFFALRLLPVNYAGVLLILFGLLLFALEIKIPSHGALTVGGVISLVLGSMILIDAPSPDLRLSLRFVLPVVLGFAAIAVFLIRLGVAAQRQPAVTGAAGMIGETGEVLVPIEPGRAGQIRVHGETWLAAAAEPIAAGSRVRVTQIDGLTLTVRQV